MNIYSRTLKAFYNLRNWLYIIIEPEEYPGENQWCIEAYAEKILESAKLVYNN